MSRCVLQQLRCPSCGVEQEEKVFLSVNGARIKTAIQRIIDGTWGEVSCTACGRRYVTDPPVLYSDLPGGVWLVRYPLEWRSRFAVLEESANRIFTEEFLERPPAAIRARAAAVRRRICFGREQFVEKLLALRHGIDDRALECLKLRLSRDLIEQLFSHGPWEWVMRSVADGQAELVAVTMTDRRPIRSTRVSIDHVLEGAEEPAQYEPFFPDLFRKLYVNASRYLTETVAA